MRQGEFCYRINTKIFGKIREIGEVTTNDYSKNE